MIVTRHMCIDIRGVLNWKGKRLHKLISHIDGKKVTDAQVREFLYDKLAEGYRVLPFGEECEGFDKVNGCPGHPKEA